MKTDIQEIEDPIGLLMGVSIHRYQFLTDEFPHLGLPVGEQFGVMAQEFSQIFPQLVTELVQPAQLDSTGNEISPETEFKAVNLNPLLPLTIAAVQQQNARLEQLEASLTNALEQLSACCAEFDGTRSVSAGGRSGGSLENDLRIVPNPVADRTELRYTVTSDGRVRLEVADASGRTIQVQNEGQHSAGSYIYEWDTTALAPGTYFCTLYINDEFLVKRSVKLDVR